MKATLYYVQYLEQRSSLHLFQARSSTSFDDKIDLFCSIIDLVIMTMRTYRDLTPLFFLAECLVNDE